MRTIRAVIEKTNTMPTIDDLKNKDLSAGMIARETAPKKTWFIKRGDGLIFACQESEAWGLFENRTNWMRRDFKIIGVSDGATYNQIIRESHGESSRLTEEISKLNGDINRYRRTEEKMVFEDLVDPNGTDPAQESDRLKLQRVKEILEGLDKKLATLQDDLKNIHKNVIEYAFNAELDIARANTKARGRIEYPSNQNIMTPGASPKERKRIMKAMAQDSDDED